MTRVLYIGGWGRSGSTLLDRLLGQVAGCFSVGEMRDIWLRGVLENRLCGCGQPFLSCPFWSEVGERAFGGWDERHARTLHSLRMRYDRPWTVPVLMMPGRWPNGLERYVDATAALYRAISDTSRAEVIVDSTKIPSYAYLLRRIEDLDLRFVHLVRDSRGVVYSWQKSVRRPDGTEQQDLMLRYGAASASGRYVLYNATASLMRRSSVPYTLVRYEDLVVDPSAFLERIIRFAGLQAAGFGFLDDGTAELRPNHTVDGNPMRFAEGPLRITADERWRTDMDRADRRMVSVLTGPLLRRYGYR
jgi:Sulfotransferase family